MDSCLADNRVRSEYLNSKEVKDEHRADRVESAPTSGNFRCMEDLIISNRRLCTCLRMKYFIVADYYMVVLKEF